MTGSAPGPGSRPPPEPLPEPLPEPHPEPQPESLPELFLDPELLPIWRAAPATPPATSPAPAPEDLLGLALGRSAAEADAVVLAAIRHAVEVDPARMTALGDHFAAALRLPRARVVVISGNTLRSLLRDWLYQVGAASGRGVMVHQLTLIDHAPAAPVLELTIGSWDSSAREVQLRLAAAGGQHSAEVSALARLVGCATVVLRVDDPVE